MIKVIHVSSSASIYIIPRSIGYWDSIKAPPGRPSCLPPMLMQRGPSDLSDRSFLSVYSLRQRNDDSHSSWITARLSSPSWALDLALPSQGVNIAFPETKVFRVPCAAVGQTREWNCVYIALGSELNLSQEDFTELALGLELSGLPFFWVLRTPSWSADSDSVKLPDGFEDRTKGHGLVWTTWAPQTKILAHDSIGGFLTHCSWSSLIETLQYGRPLIMLPFLYDQGLIARIWDKKIGIEVPRNEEDGSFTKK
ncbi:hypothetical protein L3X38_033956 [Prunus dulcis]|uniref:UDP-glycosyltransferases domain-containing protein n=1 Tax=Prunus dulcis TaxID=3755 RepID=A0AAD4VI90_PRUDU|nr:hypothetical protein L3X38_033956 [Prunus dulcis]